MKLIWTLLAISAAYGFGFHVGRNYQARKSASQAEEIHANIKRFIDASAKLRAAIDKRKRTPDTDTIANGSLPIKPGETDRALKNGEIAQFIPKDGTS